MSWAIENYDLLAIALGEHIVLVATALVLSLVIAFPLGIWTARRPALYVAAMTATGVLYTIPALALFALLIPVMGLGKVPAITALVLYSLLILVRNIAIGIREVPAELIEAADGMGYGKGRRLLRIELPMALPVIVAGIRITVVTQIAVATVAAYINAGGLGDIIFQGITQDFGEKIAAGAVLTSLLAIAADEFAEARRAAPARRHVGTPLMPGDILAWLADHPGAFETAASRHLALSVTALIAAMALALPLALVLVRWHRAGRVGDRRGQCAAHHPQPRFAGRHPAAARHRLPAVRHRAHALRPAGHSHQHPYGAARGRSRRGRGRARTGHDSSPGHAPHQGPARPARDLRRHPHGRGADRVGGDPGGVHRRRRTGRV